MGGRRRGGPATIITFLAAAAASTSGAVAMAQNNAERLAEAASGFSVAPPQGYVAQPDTSASSSEVVISLTKPGEPAPPAGFHSRPFPAFRNSPRTSSTARPTSRISTCSTATASAPSTPSRPSRISTAAGIRGAVLRATSRAKPATPGWRADLATLIFMLYTPKGLTKVTCTAAPAVFEARRGEFEAVANAVTMPR